jgi:glycosyltransferase involved in cell wall biosynthesis
MRGPHPDVPGGTTHGVGLPLVSVGLPVYNGGPSLRNALDSLLTQTLTNLELIVADNASNDSTAEICAEYAQRDPRVHVHRHDENMGAPGNWNFVARQARGRYLKWASASDLCAPTFLERCVAVLEAEPDAVLCFPRTELVAGDGKPLGPCDADFEVLSAQPAERFAEVCSRMTVNNAQSGVIRLAALRKTQYDRYYPHGDLVLMAELALLGRFRMVPEVLLFRRADRESWTGHRTPLELERLFVPSAVRPRRLLRLRRELDYLYSALRAPLPLAERMRAATFAARHLYWNRREIAFELRSMFGAK